MADTATQTQIQKTAYPILFTIAFGHFLNDMMQSVIPSVYPMMKEQYGFSFGQIGLITFTFQLMASLLQPFIGNFTDKRPQPYSLVVAMAFSLGGLALLSQAHTFPMILVSVSLVGIGSSVFHPEASRVAYLASGGKRGLAQSIFQLGGNGGTSFGPLLVALVVIGHGQGHILWFGIAALVGMFALSKIAIWYQHHLILRAAGKATFAKEAPQTLPRKKVITAMTILLLMILSKYLYMASMTNYFTFFVIRRFGLSTEQSQYYLFIFLAAIAAGTALGGPLGDRYGRKIIIWFSILGAAPFTLMLPYANLFWTGVLAAVIGVILASAFSAILVYAQELVPGKVGTISGLFFGFAFGIAGIGSASLGQLADSIGIERVFHYCAYLPLLGVIAVFLPGRAKVKD